MDAGVVRNGGLKAVKPVPRLSPARDRVRRFIGLLARAGQRFTARGSPSKIGDTQSWAKQGMLSPARLLGGTHEGPWQILFFYSASMRAISREVRGL